MSEQGDKAYAGYSDVLTAICEDKPVQFYFEDKWIAISSKKALDLIAYESPSLMSSRLRVKPEGVLINEFYMPEPLNVMPLTGETYWTLDMKIGAYPATWYGSKEERETYVSGFMWATKEDALKAMSAMAEAFRNGE